jgi:hypothetical protein
MSRPRLRTFDGSRVPWARRSASVGPSNQLADQEWDSIVPPTVEQLDEVAMLELDEQPGLDLEPACVSGAGPQNLAYHRPVRDRVPGPVDVGHATVCDGDPSYVRRRAQGRGPIGRSGREDLAPWCVSGQLGAISR